MSERERFRTNLRGSWLRRLVAAQTALLLVVFALPTGVLLAANSQTGASIVSDKGDYAPGETVTLTGAGWAAGESVSILVNDTIGQTWSHTATVTASPTGAFTDSFSLPNYFISNYTVTATGPISGTATTQFTDASIGTYDQCS